jgi:hypothetical protein
MVMPLVAFDDFLFQRHGVQGTFKSPMGVGLTIPDEKEYAKNYDLLLDKLFVKYKSPRKKRIYKAAHLVGQLLDASTNFIEDFIDAMSRYISRVDFCYSYFPADITPRIYVFKDTHPRWYTPERFIDLIQNSYVHICAWRYLQLYPDCKDYDFHLDHFQGKVTPAWEAIRDKENLYLYNSGNECDYFISSADLFLRHVQNRLSGALVRRSIRQCFTDILNGTHVDATWLGPKKDYLNNIAPNKDIDADARSKIKHPIFLIAWQNPSNRATDKDAFEWSDTYSKTMEKALEQGGCVRFWDPVHCPHIIDEKQDMVILANDLAKPIVESIRTVFRNIKVDDSLKQ